MPRALRIATLAVFAALILPASASASFGYVGGLNMFGQGSSGTLAQFSNPYGFARSASGQFFVVDTGRHKVIRLSATGQFILEFGVQGVGDGEFNYPLGVAINPVNGDVWVADSSNNRLQRFDQSGAFLGKVGGTSTGSGNGQFNGVGGVTVKSDGTVFATDVFNHRVQYFDATGTYQGQFGSSGTGDGQFNRPVGISLAENGNVYVADRLNARVQYFAPGTPYTFAGKWGCNCAEPNPVGFVAPYGVYVDQTADPDVVYVTNDYFNHTIKRFSPTGTLLNKWGPEATLDPGTALGSMFAPTAVIADSASDTAWVVENVSSRVQVFTNVSGTPTSAGSFGTPGDGDGQFKEPFGAAVADDGSVYVADTWNKRIQHLSAKNELLHQWGTAGSGPGEFEQMGGIAVAPNGDVWATNYSNEAYDLNSSRVMRFSSTGTFLNEYTSMNGQEFNFARDLDIDANGNVYVSDGSNYRVVKFASDGTFITQWGQQGTDSGDADFQYNDGIAVNAAGTEVYVVDQSSNRVKKFDGSGNFLAETGAHTFVGSATPGAFFQPSDVDIDPISGDVYISDRNNNRLQRFTSGLSYVSVFGSKGRDWAQFQQPESLAFDKGGYLWVADRTNDRVQRLGDIPVVTIQTPTDGTITTDTGIAPSYTSSDAGADCVTDPSGPYANGVVIIDVDCTNLRGTGTDSVTVTIDTIAPEVTINSPANASSTTDASVAVNYTVTDALDATPDCDIAPGAVVPLALGSNAISVTCTDHAGNQATAGVNVTRNAVPAPAPGAPDDPGITLKLAKKIKAGSKIRLQAGCAVACNVAGSLKIGSKTVRLKTIALKPGTAKSVVLKVNKSTLKKVRAALNGKKRVTLTVAVTAPGYKATTGKTGKAKISR